MQKGTHGGAVAVEVTEALIAQSQRADSNHCMIADAIRLALPHVRYVSVDLQTIRFTDPKKGERLIFFTPLLAQQQLLRFDQGTSVKPWSFRLPPRPAQIIPMARKADQTENPTARKPRNLQKVYTRHQPVVVGGTAPSPAVLSNSRGRRRIFGVKAARGFDPSVPE